MKMTVEEASHFFQETKIQDKLQLLIDLGLDYLSLGQRLSTLSGGERQRLKLTKELKQNGHIIILDEPSTGLHPSDTFKLIELLNYMVDQGNTVITIEHNLDIMTQADWIIDIGPFAGREGGELIFSGYPKDLIRTAKSLTGQYLAQYLKYT